MSPHKSKRFTNALNQTVVYWGNPQSDGSGGRSFDAAVDISVRWEDRQELFIDAAGQEQQSRAVIVLSQDVDHGGYLYLGDLNDLDSGEIADPLTVSGAYEIRHFTKSPDRQGISYFRRAML